MPAGFPAGQSGLLKRFDELVAPARAALCSAVLLGPRTSPFPPRPVSSPVGHYSARLDTQAGAPAVGSAA